MQKFDWTTFNATHDHPDGPVSRYIHDMDDFDASMSETTEPLSGVEVILRMACALVLLLGLAALKLAVS